MAGPVFHPGHHPLHGITVVVETHGPQTYVGRFDSQDDRGIHLLDAGVHDPASELTKEEYLRRTLKFGIRSEHRHVVVPTAEVARIRQLGEIEP